MSCPQNHDYELVIARPGDPFSGIQHRCRVCGIFDYESKLGMTEGKQFTLTETAGHPPFRGTLDEVFTEARKRGHTKPIRYARMARIDPVTHTEVQAIIRDADALPGGSANHHPSLADVTDYRPRKGHRIIVGDNYVPRTAPTLRLVENPA